LLLTERFDDAFRYAHRLHRIQIRKGTPIPYISHLMAVAALVLENGGSEDHAIAALLHDAAEDQGGEETLFEIREKYGAAVAAIVSDCTDSWTEPKPEWRLRKELISQSCRRSRPWHDKASRETLKSCTMIITEPNKLVGSQFIDQSQFLEQFPRHRVLDHLEDDVAAMAHDPGVDLHESFLQAR
jgi:(p)ppGpp synthase/HD superfamily hydrolase